MMEHGFHSILRIYELINLRNLQLLGKTTLLAQTIEDQLNAALIIHSLFFYKNIPEIS